MVQLTIPATYWDDYSERQAVDSPEQMAVEVRRVGSRVTVDANEIQLAYLMGDAAFYAQGNTDDTPRAVVSGAKRTVAIAKATQ